MLQQIKRRLSRLIGPKLAGADAALYATLRDTNRTYLSADRFLTLARELDRADAAGVPGAVLEFGVAAGGSAVFLARRANAKARRFIGYDLFGMIPPPGPDDPPEAHERHRIIREGKSEGLNGETYYGYEEDLFGKVSALLAQHGSPVDGEKVSLVRGLFQDTVPGNLPDPVVLAHVDCDWFEPVQLCMRELAPRMRIGAAVVLDDYADWEGCRRAADEFLAANPAFQMTQREPNAVIRRVA